MKTPPSDNMRLAADWLESNDGDERVVMLEIARWLRMQAQAKEEREACRVTGVPVARARRLIGQSNSGQIPTWDSMNRF